MLTSLEEEPSSVQDAIADAEALLPGKPVEEGPDARWQAIIEIGSFIEKEPEAVWKFIEKWGRHRQEDLRAAVGCCLLEHLLEYHFDAYFPKVESLATSNKLFAKTFLICWKFGQSEEPKNSMRFDILCEQLSARRPRRKITT